MRHLNVVFVVCLSASSMACGAAPNGGDSASGVAYSDPTLLLCPSGTASSIQFGDFNADGQPDLYVHCAGLGMAVFVNHGDGTFDNPAQFTGPTGDVVIDINGDGRDDILDTDGKVWFAQADGSFSTTHYTPMFPECTFRFDWNGDGWRDAACWSSGHLTVSSFNADGTTTDLFTASVPVDPAIADINGDGALDLIYGVGSSITVQLNAGNNTFATPQVVANAGTTVNPAGFADVDGDGYVDMLVKTASGNTATYTVLHNVAGSGFETWSTFTTNFGTYYGFADVTGDGRADLYYMDDNAQIHVEVGKGDGTFDSGGPSLSGPWSTVGAFAFGDVNADGKPDLVVASGTTAVLLRK